MPDIRIESKETATNIWPWLLGLLALLLVGRLILGGLSDNDDVEEVAAVDDVEAVGEAPARGSAIVESGHTYTLIDSRDTQTLDSNCS